MRKLTESLSSLRRLRRRGPLLGVFAGVATGLAVGGAVVAWREGIAAIQELTLGTAEDVMSPVLASLPVWRPVAALVAGGLLIGLVTRYLMPGRRPQGIPDVIAAADLHDGRMPVLGGIAAAFLTALSIGCGASVGREGPAVHLGASLAAWASRALRFTPSQARTLLGCGAAAAVAASFNAPIAGAIFAHEVVVGHYGLRALAPVVMASASATVVSRWWYGNFPAFQVPLLVLRSFAEIPAFVVLGAGCGLLAVLFMTALIRFQRVAAALPGPAFLRPAAGGLLVGLIAWGQPRVLGVGYEAMDIALRGDFVWHAVLLLLAAKFAATVLSLGMGFHGGVFSPSLILGALFGAAFGAAAYALFPQVSSAPAAYALVGAAAVSSAVLGAPISSALIVFELTADYRLAVVVMAAVVISNQVARAATGRSSFFRWQLAERGVDLAAASEHAVLGGLTVAAAMRPPEEGEEVPRDGALRSGDCLELALPRMDETGRDRLAVLETGADGEERLAGVIDRVDALAAVNRALLAALKER